MITKNTIATLGAALFLAGAPAVASAATATAVAAPSPIRVDSVQIAQYFGQFNNYFPGLVTVAYTNEGAQRVTDVVFALESNNGQLLRQYDDVTNVAEGASVNHEFSNTEEGAGQKIAVESVTFADGTVWNNATTIPARPQSQAALMDAFASSLPEYN